MKKLMNRAGLLAAAFALALAVALALNAAGRTPEVAQAQTTGVAEVQSATCDPKSHDRDGNGLIDICTPAQLNAMRYDLNGDGIADGDPLNTAYTDYLSCGQTNTSDTASCKGYELMEDISLALYDGEPSSEEVWTPIGPWGAVFDGGGFSITGLKGNSGLFSVIGAGAVVKNVDVVDAKITRDNIPGNVGVLAAVNLGTIIGSYVTGEITRKGKTAKGDIGGLVGRNQGAGKIYASVADVDIKVEDIPAGYGMRVGGFVGVNAAAIYRSYAYGDVTDNRAEGVRNAHSANPKKGFNARGFAVNQTNHRGMIHDSFSYGNKIVTNDRDKSEHPATFAYRSDSSRATDLTPGSCELDSRWKFTFAQSECATDD